MSDLPDVSQVVEIKPDCKYIIEVPVYMDQDNFRTVVDQVSDWWSSDEPFFIIGGGLTLKKVEGKPSVSHQRE